MSNIEKIRQEIERRKNICEGIFERESDTYYQGKAVAYGELLPFIDSLPDESKVDVTDFCKPIDPGIAQCIADNWWEMLGEEETPSKDLKDAAVRWEPKYGIQVSELIIHDIRDAFIAGAEWQKGQMTKDAEEGEIGYWNQTGLSIRLDQSLEKLGYDEDMKVEVIIKKKD
jgi:hypothetical protein